VSRPELETKFTDVSRPALERFRSSFRGELILPSDEAYETAPGFRNASSTGGHGAEVIRSLRRAEKGL
jgi:hypothetical protein